MKKTKVLKLAIFFLLSLFCFIPGKSEALIGNVEKNHPRLANYYLSWSIPDTETANLAKWDVLILDMEVQHNSLANLKKIRQLNPNIIILSYVTSEEIKVGYIDGVYGALRSRLQGQISDDWWLKDSSGNRVSFWPGTSMLNITDGAPLSGGQRWNDLLPKFMKEEVMSTGLWDGIFFDNIWPDVSWFNGGNFDIDCDGDRESKSEIDAKWVEGNKKLLAKMRSFLGNDYIIVANSHAFEAYQANLNGIMLESFPAPWEAGGTWSGSMNSMTNTKYFKEPQVMVVNANTDNTWNRENYQKMRFSLGSVLLGGAFLSFDYGVNNHGQTWWYDEYDALLGKPVAAPINILDKNNKNFKSGVWRRDFENGIVVVNSTKENQNYVFTGEAFNKIDGAQDRRINNGARINMVSLFGQDAVILLGDLASRKIPSAAAAPTPIPVVSKPLAPSKEQVLITKSVFENGAFYRVFNFSGQQERNGFFAYLDAYPGKAQIVVADIDNDKINETLVNSSGKITIYRDRKILRSFQPFDGIFKGSVSMAVSDLNGNGTQEIVVGAGRGGGPQVRVFDNTGRLVNAGFFAYDRNFRGGVNVAIIDLNSDGLKEIVTGAGKGGGPHIRIFSSSGAALGGFFAFDKNARNGVSIAVGNIDGQGEKEIIAGSNSGTNPEVRIFNKSGYLIKKFNAFDNVKNGLILSVSEINNDGRDEIMAGSLDY